MTSTAGRTLPLDHVYQQRKAVRHPKVGSIVFLTRDSSEAYEVLSIDGCLKELLRRPDQDRALAAAKTGGA